MFPVTLYLTGNKQDVDGGIGGCVCGWGDIRDQGEEIYAIKQKAKPILSCNTVYRVLRLIHL